MIDILLLGGSGLTGQALQDRLARSPYRFAAPPRREADLCRPPQIRHTLACLRPKLILNAAAYTQVDAAEHHPAAAEHTNHHGAATLAEAAHRIGAALIHLSTDYVFDGSLNRPYRESDLPNPLNAYGRSKLHGEQAVRAHCPRALIIRTAWLFDGWRAGFPHTIVQRARQHPSLSVVAAQYGSPTRVQTLAAVLMQLAQRLLAQPEHGGGLYHFAGYPHISRQQWTQLIVQQAHQCGLLDRLPELHPVANFPTAAARPANSRLDCTAIGRDFGITPDAWQTNEQAA